MSEPPLGLMPRDIWELQRLRDVKKALTKIVGAFLYLKLKS